MRLKEIYVRKNNAKGYVSALIIFFVFKTAKKTIDRPLMCNAYKILSLEQPPAYVTVATQYVQYTVVTLKAITSSFINNHQNHVTLSLRTHKLHR